MNFICPKCQNELTQNQQNYFCNSCKKEFSRENGFMNFLTYKRYFSDTSEKTLKKEEEANINKCNNYLIPLFQKLFAENQPLKILSVGCGSAVEIDELTSKGHEVWGADTGDRINYWIRRKTENLTIADGRNLPFPSNYFDVVMNFGVIEHVEEDASGEIRNIERMKYAQELIRVTKTGGYNIFGFPNRLFPIDFWHFKRYGMRLHSVFNDFLASYSDIRRYLKNTQVKCVTVLPLKNYFSFKVTDFNPYLKTFIKPFSLYLRAVSSGPEWLRRSPLNPHLVLLIKK